MMKKKKFLSSNPCGSTRASYARHTLLMAAILTLRMKEKEARTIRWGGGTITRDKMHGDVLFTPLYGGKIAHIT